MDRVRRQINYEEALKQGLSGNNIGVGVLDSGISLHEDLKNCVSIFKDFMKKPHKFPYDDTGHGTHVCGILAGNGASSNGKYKGIAPNVNLCVGKILNNDGEGDIKTLIDGLEWLLSIAHVNNIKVINISISSIDFVKDSERVRLLQLFEKAYENNILIVTAAGNLGPAGSSISKLGDSPHVICVGCHDGEYKSGDGKRCQDCSGRGPGLKVWRKPDVVAPGTEIYSCSLQNGKYIAKSGTSMATPIVSGIIALAFEKYPDYTSEQMKRKLLLSSVDLKESFLMQGFGMVNLAKMLS